MGLRSAVKKVGQQVGRVVTKAAQQVEEAVTPHIKNIVEGKEYRAEKCFEMFKENKIKMVSKATGQEVTKWEDFGARIDRDWNGDYDLTFCLKEFATEGFIPGSRSDSGNITKPVQPTEGEL